MDDRRAVLHLAEEATFGRLALFLPGRDSDEQHTVRLQSHTTGSVIPDQPTIVVEQGHLLLAGVFADVLALGPTSDPGSPNATPTTVHVPAKSVVHQMRGVVALGSSTAGSPQRKQPTDCSTGSPRRTAPASGRAGGRRGRGSCWPSRRRRTGSCWSNPARAADGTDATISTGVLVGADVTRLSFAELDRHEGLDVFSPDPVALERKARSRPERAAARQSNARHLSRVAQLVEGRSATGSVRSTANWSASTAHAATGRGLERFGRLIARWLGYGQRPMPALVLLVVLVAGMTLGLTVTGPEAMVCEEVFRDADSAKAVAGCATTCAARSIASSRCRHITRGRPPP